MRILFINQFFWPELAPTSQLLTAVTRQLSADGHDVSVICSAGGYAGDDDTAAPEGVDVHRVWQPKYGRSAIHRMLSYGSFFSGATFRALTMEKPDLVVTLTTPPLVFAIGALMRKLRGTDFQIWEMDMYPDVMVDLGVVKPGSLPDRLIGKVADWSREHATRVVALGECMRMRLMKRGVPEEKIEIAENWADGSRMRPARRTPDGTLRVIYAGNLGMGHDVETLKQALTRYANDKVLHVRFVGGGAKYNKLKEWCAAEGIGNVEFLPYCTPTDLAPMLAESDAALVTQLPEVVGSIVPSKVYSMMAAGLPLLYIGPQEATPAHVARRFQCGWQIEVGDAASLINLIPVLAANPNLAVQAGQNAHQAFTEHFSAEAGVARLISALGLAPARTPRTAAAAVGV